MRATKMFFFAAMAYSLSSLSMGDVQGDCGGGVGLANPAAVKCNDNGGVYSTEDGLCRFKKDGSQCDGWAYFHKKCAPGQCKVWKDNACAELMEGATNTPVVTEPTTQCEQTVSTGVTQCDSVVKTPVDQTGGSIETPSVVQTEVVVATVTETPGCCTTGGCGKAACPCPGECTCPKNVTACCVGQADGGGQDGTRSEGSCTRQGDGACDTAGGSAT